MTVLRRFLQRLRARLLRRCRSRRLRAQQNLAQVQQRTQRILARLEALGVDVEVIRREGL